jgi:hypothetical protein
MKKIKIKIVVLTSVLFITNSLHLFSQKTPAEFSIFGGGGVSFFCYQSSSNKVFSIGYNCDIGVGFTGFVSEMCGFHVGAGFGTFKVKAKVGDIVLFTPGLTDSNGYPFELSSNLIGYSEIHKTMFLNFPVMFQFQTSQRQMRGGTKNFYAMAGAKLLMLLNRKYDLEIEKIYNIAYYPKFDNYAATQTFAGLGEFPGKDANEKYKIEFLPMFAFETGIKWNIGNNLLLYTGAYFDCGLTDPTLKNRKPLSEYSYEESISLIEFYKKSFLMDEGIKLRLAFYKPSQKRSYGKMPCHYTY